MLPTVSEVILVNEPDLPSRLGDLADGDLLLVPFFHVPFPIFGIEGSVVFPPDNELVQMAILPAHDDLKDFVKFAQRAIRHLNPPPYRWMALLEGDLELIDGTRLVNRLAFLHKVLPFQVIQEVVDFVEGGVQPLPVSGWDVGERGVNLLAHLLQFLLRELDELLIPGCLLDPGFEIHRKPS